MMAGSPFRNAGIVAAAFGVILVAIIFIGQFRAQADSQEATESAATAALFAPFVAAEKSTPDAALGAKDDPPKADARGAKPDTNPTESSPPTGGVAPNKTKTLPESEAQIPPSDLKRAAPQTPSKSVSEGHLADEAKPPPISPDDIRRVIGEQYRPVAKRCYEETRAQFPDAQVDGRVELFFDIIAENNQGRVELAEPGEGSTLFAGGLHDCMLDGLGDVVFPVPEGEQKVRVKYPFNFAQAQAGEGGD